MNYNDDFRPNLAIIYGPLLHYRLALFNVIGRKYNLTVFTPEFYGDESLLTFKVCVIKSLQFGPFIFQPKLRNQLKHGKFDACISFFDVCHLDALFAVFFPVIPRMFCWGIWLTSSVIANRIRLAGVKRCEAALFYCQKHLEELALRGCDINKLYVAPNTVFVPKDNNKLLLPVQRDSFLFVGTLGARKGLDRLVRLFASALPMFNREIRLILVGDGNEHFRLLSLVNELGISSYVEMPGKIIDGHILATYYSRAIVSVSLSQAGLSVLQSMGYGVPFMTLKGSLSGGETTNIVDGNNGFLVPDDDNEIISCFRYIVDNPDMLRAMSDAAQAHYDSYATIQNYAQGFFDMLERSRMTKIWRGIDSMKS